MYSAASNIENTIATMCASEGHTWVTESMLRSKVSFRGMDMLISSGKVCCSKKDNDYVFTLPSYKDKEEEIAIKILGLLTTGVPDVQKETVDCLVREYEAKSGGALDIKQKEAVEMAARNRFCVLTGGPGTGKTFTLNAIDYALRHLDTRGSIMYTAPTGKAARRIAESTGNKAYTLHKVLKITQDNLSPSTVYANIITVDEVSMLDVDVACALFDGLMPNARLILVGDVDQLPSVGPGAILRDLILSGIVPVTKLLKTFRQKGESLIIDNMKNIRDGIQHLDVGKDFIITRPSEIQGHYDNESFLLGCYIAKARQYGIDDVALLTPYRQVKYNTGADHMNNVIQAAINHSVKGLSDHGVKFLLNDRVMQLENRKECANGDVGKIVEVGAKGITVQYIDGTVDYESKNLNQLSLAYALSVHKSQGSEYKAVISCMLNEHAAMLQRNLLYTAVTRAKKDFILLGDDEAIRTAINNEASRKRITMLQERLKQAAAYYGYKQAA